MKENQATGAFSKSLSNDVRALINYDTTLVLGRTSAHTLELREDSHGLSYRAIVRKCEVLPVGKPVKAQRKRTLLPNSEKRGKRK